MKLYFLYISRVKMGSYSCFICIAIPKFFSLFTWVIFYQAFSTLSALLYIFNIVLHVLCFFFKVFCPKLAILFQQSQADIKQSKIIASLILQWMFLVPYLRTTFANSAGPQQAWLSLILSTSILSCSCRCSPPIPHFVATSKTLIASLY